MCYFEQSTAEEWQLHLWKFPLCFDRVKSEHKADLLAGLLRLQRLPEFRLSCESCSVLCHHWLKEEALKIHTWLLYKLYLVCGVCDIFDLVNIKYSILTQITSYA